VLLGFGKHRSQEYEKEKNAYGKGYGNEYEFDVGVHQKQLLKGVFFLQR
jgi:hypothetical protein